MNVSGTGIFVQVNPLKSDSLVRECHNDNRFKL